jgi:zinc protease
MFELISLRFTQPRADATAFAAMAGQARALLTNQMASPDVVFDQTIDAVMSRNSPRRQPETPATVDQWNLEKSLAFYKARFADAGNFTFVFVGSFTPEAMKPLVETYLATLPSTRTHETWRDLGIMPPTGVVEKTIEKGVAPRTDVAIIFSGPFEYSEKNALALQAMTLILQSRLFDTIRQELGGTYSIEATPVSMKIPRPEFRVRIEWTCDPAKTTALVQRVFEEIDFVKGMTLSPGQMARVRDSMVRDFERNSQDNGYLLREISRRYENGESADLSGVVNLQARIGALTGADIRDAAQKYLNTNNYVKVIRMPAR